MKVVIFGIGKLAEYVDYALTHDSKYTVSAFCIEAEFMPQVRSLREREIVDFNQLETLYPAAEYSLFIAIGNNTVRERLYHVARDRGYNLISYVSSKAILWEDLKLGDNVFISEATGIQPFVSIGNNTILFGPRIGHHCKIGSNVLLSGCYLGGNAVIGDNSFLGLNSTVNQNVKIGKENIIGVGANIGKSTGDYEVYTNSGTVKRNISAQRIANNYLH